MVRHKVRLRFGKEGELRFIGHRDLLRTVERTLRRAELPLRHSEGFHPKPRMAFASALGVGIEGREEVLEIELCEPLAAQEVLARLRACSPPGLTWHQAETIDAREKARVQAVEYELPVPPERSETLARRIDEFLAAAEWVVPRRRTDRKRPPVDLRPYVLDLSVASGRLRMRLQVTPAGAVRPEEVAGALGLSDWLDEGAYFTRTRVELAP